MGNHPPRAQAISSPQPHQDRGPHGGWNSEGVHNEGRSRARNRERDLTTIQSSGKRPCLSGRTVRPPGLLSRYRSSAGNPCRDICAAPRHISSHDDNPGGNSQDMGSNGGRRSGHSSQRRGFPTLLAKSEGKNSVLILGSPLRTLQSNSSIGFPLKSSRPQTHPHLKNRIGT